MLARQPRHHDLRPRFKVSPPSGLALAGIILGFYWGYIGVILGLYWGYLRLISGLYWGYIGVILGLYWGYMGVQE